MHASSSRLLYCKMAAAAVPGTWHREEGLECQDYAAAVRGPTSCAIALADGAGSAPRSAIGARLAVRESLRLLVREFDALLELQPDDATTRVLSRVRLGLERYAQRKSVFFGDLASTLLVAATNGSAFVAGQLGDGRVVIFDRSVAKPRSLFEPTKGEFFNQTVFTTSDDAARHFRWQRGDVLDAQGLALMSDGPDEALYNRAEAAVAPALGRMLGWLSSYSERRVRRALSDNLAKVIAGVTSDDLSIALLRWDTGSSRGDGSKLSRQENNA